MLEDHPETRDQHLTQLGDRLGQQRPSLSKKSRQ